MKYNKINNVLNIGKHLMEKCVAPGDVVLDCTVGNGHDTLLLAKLVGPTGNVYGFDIQEAAIKNTERLLKEKGVKTNVKLFLDSHEYIDKYIHSHLNCIIYNLGYLPGGNKGIKTIPESTIKSLKGSLRLLKDNGVLMVTVYPGHKGGMEEKLSVEELFSSLDQKKFHVLKYEFINQINHPPILYFIEKAKSNQY